MRKILLSASILIAALFLTRVEAQNTIQYGIPAVFFNNTALAVVNGTTYALPQGQANFLAWCTSYGTTPTSVSWTLRGSNDGTTFNILDQISATTSFCRNYALAVRFIRAEITAFMGGTTTTSSFNVVRGGQFGNVVAARQFTTGAPDTSTTPSYTSFNPTTGWNSPASGTFRILANGAAIADFAPSSLNIYGTNPGIVLGTSDTTGVLFRRPGNGTVDIRLGDNSGGGQIGAASINTYGGTNGGWRPSVASAANANPPANEVRVYIREDLDSSGAGGADCDLVARLSSGTEVLITRLVLNGGCP